MWKDGAIAEFLGGITGSPASNDDHTFRPLTDDEQAAKDLEYAQLQKAEADRKGRKIVQMKKPTFDPRKAKAQVDALTYDIDALKGGMALRQQQHDEMIGKLHQDHIETQRHDMAALSTKEAARTEIEMQSLKWADSVGALKHLILEGDVAAIPRTHPPEALETIETTKPVAIESANDE